MAARYPNARILLTMGAEGSIYYDGSNSFKQGVITTSVVDTTAAGDTYLGYFVAGISEEEDIPKVLHRAACAAAIAVSRKGAMQSIPSASEIRILLQRGAILPGR